MTIGEFTIILSYFNIIIGCFKYFSSIGRSYQDNKVAFNRIKDLLNIKKMSNGIYILDDINSINCKALTFKRNETIIIDHFDYSFLKGNSYCICGENGKGKSTLIELIVGLHQEEYDGVIKINNISTDEIDIISVRKRLVSVMEQDINILKGSLEENINLNENYNLNYDFLQENDDLFTFVKNRDEIFNTGISGGEKLKIGLLRTFSKNAKLYILDEPTSALDSRGAKHVSQIIKKFKNDAIIIVISHDPQIINSCDYIIKL